MHRCTERTRRKLNPDVKCLRCKQPLRPGELYRERVIVNEEYCDSPFALDVAHTACVSWFEDWALVEPPQRWTRPPLGELTEKEQDVLLHMLGIGEHIETSRHGYRNGYLASPGHHGMGALEALEAKGLVVRGGTCNGNDRYFHATRAGGAAVGRPDLGVEVKS